MGVAPTGATPISRLGGSEMIVINGDMLAMPSGILCHQANCQGKMGAGIAKSIRDKWPITYEIYADEHRRGLLRLGYVSFAYVGEEYVTVRGVALHTADSKAITRLAVASICSQDKYWPRNVCHTDYAALEHGLITLVQLRGMIEKATGYKYPIYIPHGMGCGLAGGNWGIVQEIINRNVPDATIVKFKSR
jgi:hypothetical protein